MKDTLATGSVASAATTVAAAALGQLENGAAAGPIDAVSHILWGTEALRTDAVDVRHTLAGAGLNAAAVLGWAALHETMMPRRSRPSVQRALLSGAATSAVAYFTDYHVVPKRLTPGFEERLSRRSLFAVYATLALALAAGSLMRER
ncbi:MAG: hypothetical protein JNM62_13870 [Flavobacteriales bacterium]|nr:hypothetical protein [Flavobacteriales bacterium]